MSQYINGKDILDTSVDAFNAVPSADSADNVTLADVAGNKTDTTGGNSLVSLVKGTSTVAVVGNLDDAAATGAVSNVKKMMAYVKQIVTNLLAAAIKLTNILEKVEDINEAAGAFITNRAVTAKLHVSPKGDNSDGSSVSKAFITIQGALAAALPGADDLTLILVHPGVYDINATDDPTFAGNYKIRGSHRNWAVIKNNHGSATSILKFTGRVSLQDLTFDCGTGSNNGVIISGPNTKGARLRQVYFECENVTGAQIALEISGGTEYAILENVKVHGVVANTKGLLINDCQLSNFEQLEFHDCATGIQITNANSDQNIFRNILFHECTLALDLDAGNKQIFKNLEFFECTTNIDDEVGDHFYIDIRGRFPISNEPDDFIGVAVDTGNGTNIWTVAEVEVRAAATSIVPFKVIGLSLEAGTSEKYRIRLSADGGSTYFFDSQFEGVASGVNSVSLNFHGETKFIFNKGTQIVASSKSESAGVDNLNVWLEIQEI